VRNKVPGCWPRLGNKSAEAIHAVSAQRQPAAIGRGITLRKPVSSGSCWISDGYDGVLGDAMVARRLALLRRAAKSA
jgi:hypothetical protein